VSFDTDNIVVGLGTKVLVADKGTTAPGDVTAAWASGWVEVGGISENGLTISVSKDVEKKRLWQSKGIVKVIVKSIEFTAKLELVEWNAITFPLWYSGGAWTPITGHTGQFRYDVSSEPDTDERMFGFEWKVDDSTFRLVVPRGQVSDVGDAKLVNNDWTPVETTVEGLATSGSPIAFYLTDFAGVDPA
jgi:hypothetical protein